MPPTAPARVTAGRDDGFSLVEAVVALAIATAIFTALAFALIGGAKSSLLSQQNQQAGDVLNQAVERARALPYEALALRQTDLDVGEPTDASRIPALSAGFYNARTGTTGGTVATGLEPLAPRDTNGGLFPHVTQVTQNNGTYTVRRYVTVPSDASGAVYKRLTVVVQWSTLGKQRSRTYSTLVAATKRGLPLPDFKFTNAASLGQCRNPGSDVVFAFNLKNNGARDSWLLTSVPATPVWSYYTDSNGNGGYDPGTDLALATTAATPVTPTTGLLEPTTSQAFFAVLQLSAAAVLPPPYTLSSTFRATSAAQPTYFQELTAVTTVQAAACGATPVLSPAPSPSPTAAPPPAPAQPLLSCPSLTGPVATSVNGSGTMVAYHPVNPNQPGDTVAGLDAPVLKSSASSLATGSLYNYSTNLHPVAGRYLQTPAGAVGADLASWTYGMPASSALQGTGEVTVWAQPADGSLLARPSFAVRLERLSSTGVVLGSPLATATYSTPITGWLCAGLRPFSVSLPIANTSVAANEKLRLRVTVTNNVPVRLGYGTTSYPMTMTLPIKSGLG